MWLARTLMALLGRAGPRGRGALAAVVGALAYALGIRRRLALDNLARALPELDERRRRRIAQASYRNMALTALEGMASLDDGEDAGLRFPDWPRLEAALADGKGVLVATAHIGGWERFAALVARRGVKVNAVVRPLRGRLNARIVESRLRAGVQLIAQRGALSGMVAALRRGELVAQLVDQALPNGRGVLVPFFGRPAWTSPALSLAALRTGAPVFVLAALREGHEGTLRVECSGPLTVPLTGRRREDLAAHVAAVTGEIERLVRRHPEQWLWLHRRWKGAP